MHRIAIGIMGTLLIMTVPACDLKPAGKAEPAPKRVATTTAAPAAEPPPDPDKAGGPVFVHAPAEGDVAEMVKAELGRAGNDTVIVYVSAAWCEPCRYFEKAVSSGELSKEFPTLRLFKFDFDRDESRLAQAGYISEMIPLFAIPGPDGRAGDLRMEGSVKGADAVAINIAPRLRALLAAQAR